MTSQPSSAGSQETGSRSRRRASSAWGSVASCSNVAPAPTANRCERGSQGALPMAAHTAQLSRSSIRTTTSSPAVLPIARRTDALTGRR